MGREQYENMNQVSSKKSFQELRRWRKERVGKIKDLSYVVPTFEPRRIDYLQLNRTETTITWIGHASFLLQMKGLNILTDPVWAERMGFERRLARPGLKLRELPSIDIILLSHAHYDHLNLPTLRAVCAANERYRGEQPLLLVPSGLSQWLTRKGFKKVEELGWWQSRTIGEVELSFVPAQHWTRRTLWDMNSSHWGGWVLRTEGKRSIYFAGDSGYFPGFRMIGEKYRPDYVLMPIGAYEPEWFMGQQHVTPEQAIQAFLDAEGSVLIPMHYGTFRLADDTAAEALGRLHAEWTRRQPGGKRLAVMTHGETIVAGE
jgi:L-ascorbate metabolism protein UlaG (beta-lactamase superfamily)